MLLLDPPLLVPVQETELQPGRLDTQADRRLTITVGNVGGRQRVLQFFRQNRRWRSHEHQASLVGAWTRAGSTWSGQRRAAGGSGGEEGREGHIGDISRSACEATALV